MTSAIAASYEGDLDIDEGLLADLIASRRAVVVKLDELPALGGGSAEEP
jgi:hypothetical protein